MLSRPGSHRRGRTIGLILEPLERRIVPAAPAGNDLIWRSYAAANAFTLHSNPGATKVIYLDFDGHTVSGTSWNSTYNSGNDIVQEAWSMDSDRTTFSTAERDKIIELWRMIAEDFVPFDVDVTTQDPGVAALTKSNAADTTYGMRALIGPRPTVSNPTPSGSPDWDTAGGLASTPSFGSSVDVTCFSWNGDSSSTPEISLPDTVSHEVGHTLGLRHDGTSTSGYYLGHGTGAVSWGPIMGAPYGQSLSQWSRDSYPDADNSEDDLAIITGSNGFGYRPDDYGNSIGTAHAIGAQFQATLTTTYGIIEQNTDSDFFAFYAAGGPASIQIEALFVGRNLDILAELYNASGTLIATSNPIDDVDASFVMNLPSTGLYYIRVSGTGRTGTDGYSNYGSLGNYRISGTVTQPTDLTINGDATPNQNDVIRLVQDATVPNRLNVFINNSTSTPNAFYSTQVINRIIVNGLGGNDTLILDFSRGNFIPANGLTYAGGAGANQLRTDGGTFATEVFTPTSSNAGTVQFGSSTITFSDLFLFTDMAGVTTATYNATSGDDVIGLTDGAVVSGKQTARFSSATSAFTMVDLANKTNVRINALQGNDAVRLNNPASAEGLASLDFDGGAGTNSLTGPNAALKWKLTGVNAGTIAALNALFGSFQTLIGGDQRDVFAIGGGGSIQGRINGGGGSNWLDYSEVAGGVRANLAAGTGSRISGGFTGIRHLMGSAGGGDNLVGNGGGSVVVGHGNNNTVRAATGRNLIIGGYGLNSGVGGKNDDIIIAGRTIYDNDYVALEAILATWKSAASYQGRIAALRSGPYRLIVGQTVFVHPGRNNGRGPRFGATAGSLYDSVLVGDNGQDWYFAANARAISGRAANERIN